MLLCLWHLLGMLSLYKTWTCSPSWYTSPGWRWELKHLALEGVSLSRGSCPQGEAHPLVNISPFQYLLNIFGVSLRLLQENSPKENPW